MDTEVAAQKELEAEIALLKQIGQGDRRSFETLYDRFSRVLFSTAYRVLNNQEAAEDVLQDVFIQIWEKAPLYDPSRGKPMTWAITLTRNKAIDRLRSTQRRGRLQDELMQASQSAEQFDDRNSFDAASTGDTNKLVHEAIHKLSKDQREAIELAFFSSLTQTEISERLKLPLGTVKARIRRGMMRLKELLSPRL
jgi:RNA polymerase sigma-70 factor (ECF subfamily)